MPQGVEHRIWRQYADDASPREDSIDAARR